MLHWNLGCRSHTSPRARVPQGYSTRTSHPPALGPALKCLGRWGKWLITSRESNLSVMIDKLLFILQNPYQVFWWKKLTRWKKWGSRLQTCRAATKAGQNSRDGSGVGGGEDSEETNLELSTRFWSPWGEGLGWCQRPLLTDQEANCWNRKLGTNQVKLGWGCSICGQVGRGIDLPPSTPALFCQGNILPTVLTSCFTHLFLSIHILRRALQSAKSINSLIVFCSN